MSVNQMGYHIKEGFRSVFSHGLMSFAATCMIVACLLIMGSFSLVAVNIDDMLKGLEADNEFLAYIDENLSDEEAQALAAKISAVENVADITFVTRDEAMEDFMQERDEALFSDLPSEVLRHRYRIHVTDIEQMATTVEAGKQV